MSVVSICSMTAHLIFSCFSLLLSFPLLLFILLLSWQGWHCRSSTKKAGARGSQRQEGIRTSDVVDRMTAECADRADWLSSTLVHAAPAHSRRRLFSFASLAGSLFVLYRTSMPEEGQWWFFGYAPCVVLVQIDMGLSSCSRV